MSFYLSVSLEFRSSGNKELIINMDNLVNELLKEIIQSSTKIEKPRLQEAEAPNILSWSSIPEIPISEIGWSNMTTKEGKEVHKFYAATFFSVVAIGLM